MEREHVFTQADTSPEDRGGSGYWTYLELIRKLILTLPDVIARRHRRSNLRIEPEIASLAGRRSLAMTKQRFSDRFLFIRPNKPSFLWVRRSWPRWHKAGEGLVVGNTGLCDRTDPPLQLTEGILAFTTLSLVLILLVMVGIKVVAAQAPTPSDDEVNAVARELYCPVCENIPLDVCPTTACAQWRELIRQMLAQGKSKEQIKQYFVAQYGDRVLAEPPRSGLNWLAYGLPPVIFLVGVYLVYRGLRGASARRTKPVAAPAVPPPADNADPYLAQVEEELRKRL